MKRILYLKSYISNLKDGFTIVELLVAMGVFIVLLGIVVGTFIGSLKSQRSIVALMLANDNASLVLEQMAREIRTGKSFSISGNQLIFENASDEDVAYRVNNEAIERGTGLPARFSPITSNAVKVTDLDFIILPQANWPPRITIRLEVGSRNLELGSVKTVIQTTVSGRNIKA